MFYKKYNAIFARCSFHTVKFISLCKLIKLLPTNFWWVIFLLYICKC